MKWLIVGPVGGVIMGSSPGPLSENPTLSDNFVLELLGPGRVLALMENRGGSFHALSWFP